MAKTNTPQPRRIVTDEDIENVRRWRAEGKNMNEIQSFLRCGWKIISKIMDAASVDRGPKPRSALFWTEERREKLRHLITEEKVTVAEAARRLGSTPLGTAGAMARYRIYDFKVVIDRDGVSRTESRKWTLKEGDERRLRELAASGKTSRQIAEEFGVTKSAVTARCWRMKIAIVGREPASERASRFGRKKRSVEPREKRVRMGAVRKPAVRKPAVRKPAQPSFMKSNQWKPPIERPRPEILTLFDQQKIAAGTKSIVDIERNDCKYLYSVDDETRYCGDPVAYKSYCQHHAAVVYRQRDERLTADDRRRGSGFIFANTQEEGREQWRTTRAS